MKVLVCGSREWKDAAYIFTRLDEVHELYGISEIIEGCARGADQIAEVWARDRGRQLSHFPADWERMGKAAGILRNRRMLIEGKPEMVIAFHRALNQSRGTADMVVRARKAGVPTYVFPHSHEGYSG